MSSGPGVVFQTSGRARQVLRGGVGKQNTEWNHSRRDEGSSKRLPHRRPPPQGTGRWPRAARALAPAGRDAPRGRGLPETQGGRNPQAEEPIMAELRSVDPRILQPNPNNPRTTPVPPAMDEQLLASIKAVGIIQPPCVTLKDDTLMIAVGNRRVKAAIEAELPVIDVLVCDADEAAAAMRAVAENLIRASMSSVDIWRAIERLEARGWNEQAIADALALPVRTVRRLKLLAHLHPPMLDVMALGSMPSEDQLRTIAAASLEEQAQVWKKNKPKKGDDFSWYHVAHALSKRRIPFAAAKFD